MKKLLPVLTLFLFSPLFALELSIDLEKAHPISRHVYGMNSMLTLFSPKFNDPAIIELVKSLDGPFMRYPGGTVANYFNWRDGMFHKHDYLSQASLKRAEAFEKVVQNKKGATGGEDYRQFVDFVKRTGVKFTLVLNLATETHEGNREFLEALKKEGVILSHVELGNELYFGTYEWAFKTAADYVKRAKKETAMIKEIFPEAKTGVVIPSHVYTKESFLAVADEKPRYQRQAQWYDLLEAEDFYDAVVIHLYSEIGINHKAKTLLPSEEMYLHCWNHADGNMLQALDFVKEKYPGKEVWGTEYHVGGFGGIARKSRLRYTYLGGLFASGIMLKLFSRPEVKTASWHNMIQWVDLPREYRNSALPKDFRFSPDQHKVNYHFFKSFNSAVNKCKSYMPVTINGARQYPKKGKYVSKRTDIEAGYFSINENSGILYLVNKYKNKHTLRNITLGDVTMKVKKGTIIAPKDVNSLEEENEFKEVPVSEGTLTIPPYSLTRVILVKD